MSDEFRIIKLEATIIAERALADDLAAGLRLARSYIEAIDEGDARKLDRLEARYREARQR